MATVTELRQWNNGRRSEYSVESFEIFVSDVRIIPESRAARVLAEVTMNASCDFQIKVMHGHLQATAAKETETLDEGHPYDVIPEFYIGDSRNPAISPDAIRYHRGHQHSTCALAAKSGHPASPRKDTSRNSLSSARSARYDPWFFERPWKVPTDPSLFTT